MDKNKINENLIRISAGHIVIPNELKIDDEVVLKVSGQIVKIEDKSNQDGTINRIYCVKGMISDVIDIIHYKGNDEIKA